MIYKKNREIGIVMMVNEYRKLFLIVVDSNNKDLYSNSNDGYRKRYNSSLLKLHT